MAPILHITILHLEKPNIPCIRQNTTKPFPILESGSLVTYTLYLTII